jgi:hypothetical protein
VTLRRPELVAYLPFVREPRRLPDPATERNATWQPIDATPMHPEYPCAHCIINSAVAAVVRAVLGTDEIP